MCLFFLLPGFSRQFLLLSRLLIVEFRHGLSIAVELEPLTVAMAGQAAARRKVGMIEDEAVKSRAGLPRSIH